MSKFHLKGFNSYRAWCIGNMRHAILMVCLLLATIIQAANVLKVSGKSGTCPLVVQGHVPTIYVSSDESLTLRHVAGVFADDVERVSGVRPTQTSEPSTATIVVATLGHNKYIDRLIKSRQIDVSPIRGGREQFVIKVVGQQLVVVGSDRRGAAYGLLTLSEQMGVSPWYWFADVPVVHLQEIYLDADYVSQAPSIKYRGFFINDEDWGLKTWAAQNYEKELGDIGPKTYDRVCELLLRLKGNMLAPAMHSCTGAFYSHPESQAVADKWGIMITTSHCEPLLFNNAVQSEWDKSRDGEWNYETNSTTILRKLDDRIRETAPYDNIYTMGMRGLHDEAMKGSTDPKDRARTLEKVFDKQRQILKKYKKQNVEKLPQIFVPYKETLDIYDAGLRVPEDITLVWPDDNYGYMKRVSNTREQQRKGGSGVYYHLSYLGTPHDNLWIATTAPMLMYEELLKAYSAGAKRYWLLNVGDIKPMEIEIQHFFDMAYDFASFNYDNANRYQAQWLAKVFAPSDFRPQTSALTAQFQFILDNYYRLAWDRKPEFMGYEYEWSSREENRLHDTDFSFETGSAQKRLTDYQVICDVYDAIERQTPAEYRPALFELLGYAVYSAYQMNRKFLYAQRNHETGSAIYAELSREAYREIDRLRERYHSLLNGKWNQMISEVPPGFCAKYQQMPAFSNQPTDSFRLPAEQIHPELPHQVNLATLNVTAPFRLLEGIGTDWVALQMGQPLDFNTTGSIDIPLPASSCHPSSPSTLSVCLSVVPMWPVASDRSNRIQVSVDGGTPQVCENVFKEWGPKWKMQVLENRKEFVVTFPIDKSRKEHVITLSIVDPGQIVQKITYEYK